MHCVFSSWTRAWVKCVRHPLVLNQPNKRARVLEGYEFDCSEQNRRLGRRDEHVVVRRSCLFG